MAGISSIEWTDKTWNPIVGCSIKSPGCKNCYAMKLAARLARMGNPLYRGLTEETKAGAVWTGELRCAPPKTLYAPTRWRKPRRIFVNSMSDLFHESLQWSHIDEVFDVMEACPQHTLQVLTKRSSIMRAYISSRYNDHCPPPHIWLGVSVEDRARKDRIDDLRATPAAVRFISFEPLLEDIGDVDLTGIHQVITGGESGHRRRPHDVEWQRSILRQARAQGCAFFGKQDDKVRPLPPDLMVREWPTAAPHPHP